MKCICGKETDNPKYCSRKCAVSVNNSRYPKREKIIGNSNCAYCGSSLFGIGNNKYCNKKCEFLGKEEEKNLQIEKGIVTRNPTLKRYLIGKKGEKCSKCLLSKWLGNKIPLEVNHIDGNSENNFPNNLELICPNCHVFTPNYKGKNKGNGRFLRLQRYRDGRSY